MVVICDTSPITNLMQVGYLHLLPSLFQEVVIAEEVFGELCAIAEQEKALKDANWLVRRRPTDLDLVEKLKTQMDSGEAASISLAFELQADLLLIDEKKGRMVAQSMQLTVTGLLGILMRAKKEGHISLVKPILEKLREQTSFRIHPNLYNEVLQFTNEL